jgi:hypothetical protein
VPRRICGAATEENLPPLTSLQMCLGAQLTQVFGVFVVLIKSTCRDAELLRFKCITILCEEAATLLLSQSQHRRNSCGICAWSAWTAVVLISLVLTTMDMLKYVLVTPR